MWLHKQREISKEDFDAIKAGKKKEDDFFDICEICGYGAITHSAVEKDGKYYIPYGISDSCD